MNSHGWAFIYFIPLLKPKRAPGARIINLFTKSAASVLQPPGIYDFLITCCFDKTASLIYILLFPEYGLYFKTFIPSPASISAQLFQSHRNQPQMSASACTVPQEPCIQESHSHQEPVCCSMTLLSQNQSVASTPVRQIPGFKALYPCGIFSCGECTQPM